jgi:hypothetical protein
VDQSLQGLNYDQNQNFMIPIIQSPQNGIISQSNSNFESLKNTKSVKNNEIMGKLSVIKDRSNLNVDINQMKIMT